MENCLHLGTRMMQLQRSDDVREHQRKRTEITKATCDVREAGREKKIKKRDSPVRKQHMYKDHKDAFEMNDPKKNFL